MTNPPPSIQVNDREELIFLLTEAAEFEHTVMCSYLYAMWSLERDVSSRVSTEEMIAVDRWRTEIRRVALEEMLHLTLVNNLLTAVGAGPHLWRPSFPVGRGVFPADVLLTLAPFCEGSLSHFVYLERPEGIDLVDGAGFHHVDHYRRVRRADLLSPTPQDYDSQGHLYHGIAAGLGHLAEQLGEDALFVGDPNAQVGPEDFGLPGLFKIKNLQTAYAALEEIVLQGEGAPAHAEDSHYARFRRVHDEFVAMSAARPGFQPAKNAATNPVLSDHRGEGTLITNPTARQVVDLGDSTYTLMIRIFAQVFSPVPLAPDVRADLAALATDVMYAVSRLAEAATGLPISAEQPEVMAGLTLELPPSIGQLVPSAASRILEERTREIATAAATLEGRIEGLQVADRLFDVADRLASIDMSATSSSVGRTPAAPDPATEPEGIVPTPEPDAEVDINTARSEHLVLHFDSGRCIHSRHCVLSLPKVFLANVQGAWLHPEAASPEALIEVAHRCPSGAITYVRLDGGPEEANPGVNVLRIRENGPYGLRANIDLEGVGHLKRCTLCRCGASRNKPFCDGSHHGIGFTASGEPKTMASDALENRGGPLRVTPTRNGPLQVRGNLEVCAGTGRTVQRLRTARLCRCGGSRTKPFCDGTHERIGFVTETEDP